MSTRYQKESDPNVIPGGYEGDNVPEDFEIPSCSLEDVDKALFDLFNEEIFPHVPISDNRPPVLTNLLSI